MVDEPQAPESGPPLVKAPRRAFPFNKTGPGLLTGGLFYAARPTGSPDATLTETRLARSSDAHRVDARSREVHARLGRLCHEVRDSTTAEVKYGDARSGLEAFKNKPRFSTRGKSGRALRVTGAMPATTSAFAKNTISPVTETIALRRRRCHHREPSTESYNPKQPGSGSAYFAPSVTSSTSATVPSTTNINAETEVIFNEGYPFS